MLAAALFLTVAASACGRKGPPLPPIVRLPAPIIDLTAKRLGGDVVLQLTVPQTNTDASRPADLDHIEIYAHTGPLPAPIDFLKYGTLIANIAVKATSATGAGDTLPGVDQGSKTSVSEKITAAEAELGKVAVIKRRPPSGKQPPALTFTDVETEGTLNAPVPTIRYYVAVPVSRRNRRGQFSAPLGVPLVEPPGAPGALQAAFAETGVTLKWEPVAPSTDVFVPPPVYNIYEVKDESTAPNVNGGPVAGAPTVASTPAPAPGPMPLAVNPAPLEVTTFLDPRVDFGQRRCYEVRTVRRMGAVSIESAPAARACLDLADTFPPAAPKSLAAVASDGVISLIWEPNAEKDLAGYIVLRGESTGDPAAAQLAPLMTDPIRETTFRDTTVKPGVSYVYAVVAVDTATPPNKSEYSNRVSEVAR